MKKTIIAGTGLYVPVLLAALCLQSACRNSETEIPAISREYAKTKKSAAVSYAALFSQNFNSSSSVSSYVSSSPGIGEFNSIGTTSSGTTVAINNSKLRFVRNTGGSGYYSRTDDFSTTPNVIQYKFDLSVSGNATYQTIGTFQVGDGFSTINNATTGTPLESDPLVHSKIALYTSATNGSFAIRDIAPNIKSEYFSGNQAITWTVNNSPVIIRYTDPLGKPETLAPDTWDLWIGTIKVFDDRASTTGSQPLKNLKFALTAGTGVTVDLDNVEVLDLSDLENTPITGDLIFHSGFEGTTALSTLTSQSLKITGIDNSVSAPNNWATDMLPSVGSFKFSFEGGDTSMRKAQIITDPTNSSNKVLHYWLADANALGFVKGRIQADAYEGDGMKEVYQSVRMYLSTDFNTIKSWDQVCDWLTIFEFWNNKTWASSPNPFRLKVTIAKPSAATGTNLYFMTTAQTYNTSTGNFANKWSVTNTSYQVPVGQWVTMEYYYKEGNNINGRFYLAITPDGGSKQVLFDINNCTQDPLATNPDGLTDFNPMKIYTSKDLIDYMKSQGKVLQIYWDDFALWKDKRP